VYLVDSFRMLICLFSEGGIEVCTPEADPSGNQSKDQVQYLVRTLIQPDADVITFVSKEAIAKPELICQHLDNIRDKLHSLAKFRKTLARIWVLCPLLVFTGFYQFRFERIGWLAATTVLSFVPLVSRPLLRNYLHHRITKEIGRLCRDTKGSS